MSKFDSSCLLKLLKNLRAKLNVKVFGMLCFCLLFKSIKDHACLAAGLGTAFFYVLNASFFCVLLKHSTSFSVLFSSFWRLMTLKRTMHSFAFFS